MFQKGIFNKIYKKIIIILCNNCLNICKIVVRHFGHVAPQFRTRLAPYCCKRVEHWGLKQSFFLKRTIMNHLYTLCFQLDLACNFNSERYSLIDQILNLIFKGYQFEHHKSQDHLRFTQSLTSWSRELVEVRVS